MSKPWVGYLSAAFLLLAGVFQIAGGNPKIGAFFIVLSVVSVILRLYMQRKKKDDDTHR
jgi:hypothetical protein